jgi:hypothetical protein
LGLSTIFFHVGPVGGKEKHVKSGEIEKLQDGGNEGKESRTV